jgi:periplasmic copper chaperone A
VIVRDLFCIICSIVALPASAAGHLSVSNAWIRQAPPGAMMLAGYADLRNDGDASLRVTGAVSPAFADASIHETIETDGVSRMRPVAAIDIAPGQIVRLAPGGKHLMLMHPQRVLVADSVVPISLQLADGSTIGARFSVRAEAPDH